MKKERIMELAGVQMNESKADNLFSVDIAWSQTDHETVLVTANSKKDAEKIVKEKLPGINHIKGVSKITQTF